MLLARRRHERAWLMIALAASFVAWIGAIGLVGTVPSEVRLSVWRPQDLFGSRLELVLDAQGWQMLFASATLLLSVLMTAVARRGEATAAGRAVMLAYTSLAMLALLAANLLTVATAWALMDLSAFAFLASVLRKEDTASVLVSRLAIDSASVLLVLGAAIAKAAAGPSLAAVGEPQPPLSVVLVSLAVLLRLGLFPPHFALPSLPGVRRGLGTLLRLLPAAVALSALARALEGGVPSTAIVWLRIGGVLGIVIGGLRWVSEPEAVGGRRFLVLGLSGLGVLLATVRGAQPEAVLTATGVLVLTIGAAISLAEIHAPAHRVAIVLAALFIAGLPVTPGGMLAQTVTAALGASGDGLVAGACIVGMLLLGVGTLRRAFARGSSWPSGESLVKLLYGAGLFLPLVSGIGLSLRSVRDVSLEGIGLAGALGLAAALAMPLARRFTGAGSGRWRRWLGYLDPSPLYTGAAFLTGQVLRALRALGDLLEGEGAMLWTYVVLLLVVLAVLRG